MLLTCWLLRALDQAPFGRAHETKNAGQFTLQVKGPKGDTVHESLVSHVTGESTLSARWTIPTDIAGGEFVASLMPQEQLWGGRAEYGAAGAERGFSVRVQRPKALKLTLDLERDSYSKYSNVEVSQAYQIPFNLPHLTCHTESRNCSASIRFDR